MPPRARSAACDYWWPLNITKSKLRWQWVFLRSSPIWKYPKVSNILSSKNLNELNFCSSDKILQHLILTTAVRSGQKTQAGCCCPALSSLLQRRRGGEERGAASQKQSSLNGISLACCWVASLSHSEYQHSLALKRCHGPIEINPNDTCLTKNLTCLGTLSIEPYEPTCDVCRQADRQTNLQSSVVLFGMGNGYKTDKVCLLLF